MKHSSSSPAKWAACPKSATAAPAAPSALAGAGIRGGQVVGETDARAEQPKDRPIRPEDITKTVYYAMGIKDLEAKDKLGRAYNLLDEGKPLTELFG